MTITNVTVGTATTGNNASVTPGTPSGIIAGDLVLIFAAIRNTGAGKPVKPTGWEKITEVTAGNVAVFGRFWQTGDVIPQITFTGGVANADTYARAMKARGVALDMLANAVTATITNASAQNIAWPAIAPPGPGHLLAMLAWKQDDATSLTTPSGWTAQGLTSTTTGDDQMNALYTFLQTTDTDQAGGTITVTGGVAAVSAVLAVALAPAPAVVVTEVDLFPPRTRITVTDLTPGDDLIVYRLVGGVRTPVRGGSASGVTDPSFVVVDGEIPFDTPVSYEVVVNAFASYVTAAVTYDLPGGKAVISDAITGESSQFVIVSWDEKTYDRQASVFKVGGRNVVVVGDLGMFESTMEVFFEAYSSTENFRALINSATEGLLQLRAPSGQYAGIDCYVSVVRAREKRFSQDGSDERRTWILEVAETETWSDGLVARAFTYQDVADYYATAGGTYATLLSDKPTYLAVRTADWT